MRPLRETVCRDRLKCLLPEGENIGISIRLHHSGHTDQSERNWVSWVPFNAGSSLHRMHNVMWSISNDRGKIFRWQTKTSRLKHRKMSQYLPLMIGTGDILCTFCSENMRPSQSRGWRVSPSARPWRPSRSWMEIPQLPRVSFHLRAQQRSQRAAIAMMFRRRQCFSGVLNGFWGTHRLKTQTQREVCPRSWHPWSGMTVFRMFPSSKSLAAKVNGRRST